MDTTDVAVRVGTAEGDRSLRQRRRLYGATSLLLGVLMALAAVAVTGLIDVYGVDTAWAREQAGGHTLRVRHATVSRGGLATPVEIEVSRRGGFDGLVTVAIDHRYLTMFDVNAVLPTPSSETVDGDLLLWEFDAPEGDTLSITLDARIEPAEQRGRAGRVVVVEGGVPVVEVGFRTRVLP